MTGEIVNPNPEDGDELCDGVKYRSNTPFLERTGNALGWGLCMTKPMRVALCSVRVGMIDLKLLDIHVCSFV